MQPGQKVICIDAAFSDAIRQEYTQLPVQDDVYVIREVRAGADADVFFMDCRVKLKISILLIGVINPRTPRGTEFGFDASRFRLLDELKAEAREKQTDKILC